MTDEDGAGNPCIIQYSDYVIGEIGNRHSSNITGLLRLTVATIVPVNRAARCEVRSQVSPDVTVAADSIAKYDGGTRISTIRITIEEARSIR